MTRRGRIALRVLGAVILAAGVTTLVWLLLLRGGGDTLGMRLAGRDLELLSPRWLLLLGVVPLVWLAATFSLTDLSRPQQILAAGLRSLLVATLVVALARPAVTRYETRAVAVYLVDVSDSVSDAQLAKAHAEVSRALRERGAHEVRVVTFARRPRLVEIPKKGPLPPFQRHQGAGDATNGSAAMRLAHALFSESRLRRIVLLSDGAETDGDLTADAYRAAESKVRLFYRSFPQAATKEVALATLVLPDRVVIGQPFTVGAEVYASYDTEALFSLTQDGLPNGLQPRQRVRLTPGRNQVTFRSVVRAPGFITYKLTASEIPQDTFPDNNRAVATLSVRGRPQVLYIEGEPSSAHYLRRALASQSIDVVVRGPHGLPRSARELDRFDLVIVSDVPRTFMALTQMTALERYVRDLGGGFIMTGGEGSFGSGGYSGTRIEKLLPVRFDTEKRREEPTLALVLLIDRSGSMSGPKIELAKEAARATAEMLGRSDLLGVVAFDARAQKLVRLQRAANRARILGDIQRLRAGGGTSFLPALREANDMLRPVSAKVKHVILLSDGQARYQGIPEIVDELQEGGITVSTVGVSHGADRTLLRMIASRGGGRFYYTEEADNLPRLFTKETTEVARSALVEQPSRAQVAKRVEMIEGTGIASAPALRGYVTTRAKPMSETILTIGGGEPLLSRWRRGLGQSAVFTSDLKNRWGIAWLRWPGYARFWAQVVRSVMRHRLTEAFDLRAEVVSGQAHVVVDAIDRNDRFVNELDSVVRVVDPARPNTHREYPLHQTAPGRYAADFPLDRHGAYVLRATHRREGRTVAESAGTLTLSYSPEYRWGEAPEGLLPRAAAITGGGEATSPAVVFDPRGEKVAFHGDLWSWFVGLVLALFLLDVLLRRVRLFGYRAQPLSRA